ncbi:MAG: exo-alpha-sialidase [Candidatus Eremiobacteraeota bacterium]|nr:exo-alpha-sialidase [Candidatus Eremiobacteraeota bacterium]
MPCPKLGPGLEYASFSGTDVQVTSSASNQSRSESVVVVNPTNAKNLICASKKFIDPVKYHFTISTSFSFNGGLTWTESVPALQPGWDGMSDPDLTFDALGNAYLIVEPITFGPTDIAGTGMYVFKSTDGGQVWGTPVLLHLDSADDKQWIEADTNPASPHLGAVYAVWGANTPLRFARSVDQGVTWKGMGAWPAGADVGFQTCFGPSITIGPDGTIHVMWHYPGTTEIMYTQSTDGGDTFSAVTAVVSGVSSLSTFLPNIDGFFHFPNGTFRVYTIVTSSVAAGNKLIVAWADFREGVSRIYYRIASGGGATWLGPASGQPLLPSYGHPDQQHFHPQLSEAGNDAIGCAFYEYGPKDTKLLIDVLVSYSCSDGTSFGNPLTVTDDPWDPAVNAPLSHGISGITFIGEYFGFFGSQDWFAVVWTDTRTGVQELFYDRVRIKAVLSTPSILGDLEVAVILAGVIQDGGGLVFVGGKIIRIPPYNPWIFVLRAAVAINSVIATIGRAIGSIARR